MYLHIKRIQYQSVYIKKQKIFNYLYIFHLNNSILNYKHQEHKVKYFFKLSKSTK